MTAAPLSDALRKSFDDVAAQFLVPGESGTVCRLCHRAAAAGEDVQHAARCALNTLLESLKTPDLPEVNLRSPAERQEEQIAELRVQVADDQSTRRPWNFTRAELRNAELALDLHAQLLEQTRQAEELRVALRAVRTTLRTMPQSARLMGFPDGPRKVFWQALSQLNAALNPGEKETHEHQH